MENLIPIGRISKIHGYKGFVKTILNQKEIKKGEPLFIEINKKPVPFFVDEISTSAEEFLIKFDDINNSEEAEELIGLNVLIKSEQAIDNDESYFLLENYSVMDKNTGYAGKVISHIPKAGQDLIQIEFNENIYYLPCVQQIINKINHKDKTIFTDIPEGIISLNE